MKKFILVLLLNVVIFSNRAFGQVDSRLVFISNTYNTPDAESGTLIFDVEAYSNGGEALINLYGNSLKLDDVFRDNFVSLDFSDHYFDTENYNYGPMDYNSVTGLVSFVYSLKPSATQRKGLAEQWQKIVRITIVYSLADAFGDIKWNSGPGGNPQNGYQVKDEYLNDITGDREPVPAELQQVPLPVELVAFSANISADNSVILKWKTVTEINNYGFYVERLKRSRKFPTTAIDDNADWETMGFVKGHGNSNAPQNYTFADNSLSAGEYFYRLKQVDVDGSFGYSPVVQVIIIAPDKFELGQNYPNPFNPATTIKYSIPEDVKHELKNVKLIVYDVLGREIKTLVDEKQSPGIYTVTFNAESAEGGLPSGIYLYKLQYGNYTEMKKMVLIK